MLIFIDTIIPKYILGYMTTNTKTLLTVKIDKNLKQAAQKTAEQIGLPLGTLVNALLRQFVRNKGVSLTTEEEYVLNKKTIASLLKGEKEYREGKLPVAHSVDELIAALNS